MKRILLGVLFLLFCTLSAETVIVKDGKAQGAIIIGKRPTRAAQFAAYELQYFVAGITGEVLPIRAVPQKTDNVRLIVGYNEYAEKAGIAPFTKEEYEIAFKGKDLILAGNDDADFGRVNYQDVNTFPADEIDIYVNGDLATELPYKKGEYDIVLDFTKLLANPDLTLARQFSVEGFGWFGEIN